MGFEGFFRLEKEMIWTPCALFQIVSLLILQHTISIAKVKHKVKHNQTETFPLVLTFYLNASFAPFDYAKKKKKSMQRDVISRLGVFAVAVQGSLDFD